MNNFLRYIALITLFLSCNFIIAQTPSNGIDIRSIHSPQPNINYRTSSYSDIIVQFINRGMNNILAGDSIHATLRIANDKNLYEVYNFKLHNERLLRVNDWFQATLIEAYHFNQDSRYAITVSVEGTDDYPSNTVKNPTKTVSFLVSQEELEKTSLKDTWYDEQQLHFSINNLTEKLVEVSVIDLAGRTILNKKMHVNQKNQLNFNPPANGVYFFRLTYKNQVITSKFVVH